MGMVLKMNGRLSYALIGCGRIAPNHITAAHNNSLDIVAVCDPIAERMEHILSFLPEEERAGVRRFTDYRDMLRECSPRLVAVATESGRHAAIGLDCIRAGCNVIIEKPLALSMEDGRRLVAEAARKGVKLCACHQNRFNKAIGKIRSAYDDNRFGRMLYGTVNVRWNRGEDYYAQAPWRGTWAQDGGALMNQCIHSIDLLRWMMGGQVKDVFAYTDRLMHPYIEAEDMGLALVRFEGGAYGIIEGTTDVYPHNLEETMCLFGENGTIKVGGKSVNIIEEWDFRDGLSDSASIKMHYRENPPNVYGFGHTPLYADMAEAITMNRKPYVSGEDGLRALELVLAIYKSAALGKPVSLPLDDCKTTDFIGRFTD